MTANASTRKSAIFTNMDLMAAGMYGGGRRERIAEITELYPEVINDTNFDQHASAMADIEVFFAAWGLPELGPERLEQLPNLKLVLYGGGSVKAFAPALFERGIQVAGGWGENAVAVAEYLLGTLLLGNKGFFHAEPRREKVGGHVWTAGIGNFERTVGLLGMGKVGRHLRELLRSFALEVLVYDPYLDDDTAKALDVESVALEELFDRSVYVCNQIPQLPDTKDLISGDLLCRLQEDATFANVANGHSLAWKDLYGVFSERAELTGIFDTIEGAYVTMPGEEVKALLDLPNVWTSPHIAGAFGWERRRMADALIDDFLRWEAGKPMQNEVTADMLPQLA